MPWMNLGDHLSLNMAALSKIECINLDNDKMGVRFWVGHLEVLNLQMSEAQTDAIKEVMERFDDGEFYDPNDALSMIPQIGLN